MELSERIRSIRRRRAHAGGLRVNSGDRVAGLSGFVWAFLLTSCPVGILMRTIGGTLYEFDETSVEVALIAPQLGIPAYVASKVARWTVSKRLRNRAEGMQHLCFGCGYDIRGLPESRCPECGEAF